MQFLRTSVEQGGRLLLAHDTAYFMASPFPDVVRGPLIPPEKGDARHILDLGVHIDPAAHACSTALSHAAASKVGL